MKWRVDVLWVWHHLVLTRLVLVLAKRIPVLSSLSLERVVRGKPYFSTSDLRIVCGGAVSP